MKDNRIYVVKAGGKRPIEEFDPIKLHKSIVASCLSLRTPEGQAEEIAHEVCLKFMHWAQNKDTITSVDIRRVSADILQKLHPEVAYIYKQQLMVL